MTVHDANDVNVLVLWRSNHRAGWATPSLLILPGSRMSIPSISGVHSFLRSYMERAASAVDAGGWWRNNE